MAGELEPAKAPASCAKSIHAEQYLAEVYRGVASMGVYLKARALDTRRPRFPLSRSEWQPVMTRVVVVRGNHDASSQCS